MTARARSAPGAYPKGYDMSNILRPGALYTCQPDESMPVLLTEVVSVDGDSNVVECTETLSNDATETRATIHPDIFGDTGTYIHVGDVRDHQNNPDVGDVFLWPMGGDESDVVEILDIDGDGTASVQLMWSFDGSRATDAYPVSAIANMAMWVGHTRPVFDTPERYGR